MWIELDDARILPAASITGTLHDAPGDGAEVTCPGLSVVLHQLPNRVQM